MTPTVILHGFGNSEEILKDIEELKNRLRKQLCALEAVVHIVPDLSAMGALMRKKIDTTGMIYHWNVTERQKEASRDALEAIVRVYCQEHKPDCEVTCQFFLDDPRTL